ncbi:hypothetical protein GCM10022236_14720 [Microlunatus ginsengisoli]|uniref:Uncharacterized protein n=1 Tax=Microlunatus ginsengisoli TaxID=363863 RepID=A0ABP6ZP28_9ACTN
MTRVAAMVSVTAVAAMPGTGVMTGVGVVPVMILLGVLLGLLRPCAEDVGMRRTRFAHTRQHTPWGYKFNPSGRSGSGEPGRW